MVTVRHVGMRWVLAGLAMTGLAAGAFAQSASGSANAGPDAVQPSDAGQAAGQQAPAQRGRAANGPRARRGGFDGPGGPRARRMGPPRWHRPPMQMMRGRGGAQALDRPLLLAFRRLNLTDQQWDRVQAILEVQHLRSGTGGTPQQRRAQIQALFNPGDPQHAQAVQAIKDRAVARIDQATRAQESLYEVLTPAQKTQLQQLATQRRDRMRQRQQQRAARRGEAQQSGHEGAGASPSGQ